MPTRKCQHRNTTVLTFKQGLLQTFRIEICHNCLIARVSTETAEFVTLEELSLKLKGEVTN